MVPPATEPMGIIWGCCGGEGASVSSTSCSVTGRGAHNLPSEGNVVAFESCWERITKLHSAHLEVFKAQVLSPGWTWQQSGRAGGLCGSHQPAPVCPRQL